MPGSSYLLEVSSPGLDRKLFKPEDYQRFTRKPGEAGDPGAGKR